MPSKRLNAYLKILITVFIWGLASVVIKATLSEVGPVTFLVYRFFISSLIAIPFISGVLKLLKNPETRLSIVVYSLLTAAFGLGILFFGLSKTSVVNLSLTQAVQPLLIIFIGAHFFHDHLSKHARIGVYLALFGALITLIEPILNGSDGATLEGNLFLVFYLLSDLVGVVILKKLMKKNVSATALTHFSFILAFAIFLPISLSQQSFSELVLEVYNLPFSYHLGVLYMAIFSGTIAYVLRASAQKTLNLSEVSLFGYLPPVISTILAIMLLSEAITPLYLVGAAIIVVGVIIAETKKHKKT